MLLKIVIWFMLPLKFFLSNTTGHRQGFRQEMSMTICKTQMDVELKDPLLHLCTKKTALFGYAVTGFRNGLQECQSAFKYNRWNCTTPKEGSYKLFDTVMARSSKEAAVMFAMVSAGMVEKVTAEIHQGKKEKYRGKVGGCNPLRRPRNVNEYINVNDCNADVSRGMDFASKVIELWQPSSKSSRKEVLMNRHNANVGRLAVKNHMQKLCRCIGLSGTCNSKCCYTTLQPLKVSVEWLRQRYRQAVKVNAKRIWKRDGSQKVAQKGVVNPRKLIYLLDSPNYCSNDFKTGSLGTKGRQCNVTSNGSDGCDRMCCWRGYETHVIEEETYCKCKFNWCCEVKCERCRRKVTVHRCK